MKAHLFNAGLQTRALTALAERFAPDALFIFMDLSVEADALGAPVRYPLHETPTVERPVLRRPSDLEGLTAEHFLDHCRIQVFLRTLRGLKRSLDLPVGGYVVGPFTLAGLLMGAAEAAEATLVHPDFLHRVLRFTTSVIDSYLQAQVEEGADLIAILEPSAAFLSPGAFGEFSAAYVAGLVQRCKVPCVLHVCGDASALIPQMAATGVEGLSLDAPVNLPEAARQVDSRVVLIGNIAPASVMARGSVSDVERAVQTLLEAMSGVPNFILSTGCDLPPETPLENIEAFMRIARQAT
jgi:uroporphyrinogen decarboxylase